METNSCGEISKLTEKLYILVRKHVHFGREIVNSEINMPQILCAEKNDKFEVWPLHRSHYSVVEHGANTKHCSLNFRLREKCKMVQF